MRLQVEAAVARVGDASASDRGGGGGTPERRLAGMEEPMNLAYDKIRALQHQLSLQSIASVV